MKQTVTLGMNEILKQALDFPRIISHGNDYLIVELTEMGNRETGSSTYYKFDGIIFLYSTNGEFIVEKRYEQIRLRKKNFMTIFPDDEVKGLKKVVDDNSSITVLFLTKAFIRDINFNLNVFASLNPLNTKPSTIQLTDPDFDMLTQYFRILEINARNCTNGKSDVFTRNIARNITAALFYNLMLLTHDNARTVLKSRNSRKTAYVIEFMDHLHNNYKMERTVKFYADKMCITPKYLSALVKEITGKSAAEWIDKCVILEAKNLLRFSGMNVQQVAYELNFPNQSAFGKYFKHVTGSSPSHFQQT